MLQLNDRQCPEVEMQEAARMSRVLVLLSPQIQTQYTGSVVPLAVFGFSLLHLHTYDKKSSLLFIVC